MWQDGGQFDVVEQVGVAEISVDFALEVQWGMLQAHGCDIPAALLAVDDKPRQTAVPWVQFELVNPIAEIAR